MTHPIFSNPTDPSRIPGTQPSSPVLQALPRRWTARVAILVFFLPLGLALLGYGIKLLLDQPENAQEGGAYLLGGLAVLAFFAWRYRAESTRRAVLTSAGLELETSGKRLAIPFDHMEEVWFNAQRIQAGGLIGMAVIALMDRMRTDKSMDERGLTIQLRVAGAGATLKLSNQDKGVFAAYQEIIRQVNPRLTLEARSRIDAGQTVAFNKVALSREGLAIGKKQRIPFAQIEKFSIQKGALSVKVKGKWFNSGQKVARIPNLYVLAELVAQLSDGKIEMDVPVGMNLVSRCCV